MEAADGGHAFMERLEVFHHVAHETDAYALWTKLESMYQSKTSRNKALLMRRLVNLKLRSGDSVAVHSSEFQNLVNQLDSVGLKFDDELQALLLLSSLLDNWETLVVSLSNSAPDGKLSMSIVKDALFNEEARRKEMGTDCEDESRALVSDGNRGRNQTRGNRRGGATVKHGTSGLKMREQLMQDVHREAQRKGTGILRKGAPKTKKRVSFALDLVSGGDLSGVVDTGGGKDPPRTARWVAVHVMEVTFEEEFPDFDVRLSPQLRKQFYEKLKHLVVVIDTMLEDGTKNGTWDGKYTLEEEDEEKFIRGGGVIMNSRGFILTCAQLIPPNFSKIQFRRVNDESFSECVLVARKADLDLAILRPVKDEGVVSDFGKFGFREFIDVGMEVFSIAHPRDLCYSLVIGQVTFPCLYDGTAPSDYPRDQTPSSRLVGFVVDDELKHLAKDLELIQINNFHGTHNLERRTSFGAPVFDSHGRVIGLNTFVLDGMDFAIHMSVLEKFWKENVSEPQENGSDPQPPKRKKRKKEKEKKQGRKAKRKLGGGQWLMDRYYFTVRLDHVLQEDLDGLHSSPASQPPDDRLRDPLDVVSEDLAVPFRASLS
ncbi:hypothetical protein RHSIM_Rhsim02G0098600 [Rhododendron simsii]|uniref:Uncharacterized protein n=1 Tax=Rhododendron simsii TaxID=118357 RepID=A0A834HH74_RHOSS|nr:hypothetical protein RHSIM_Rhsim02G0098600 [Rhododendron simsii]